MKTQAASSAVQGASAAIYYTISASGGADTVTIPATGSKGQGAGCFEVSGAWSSGSPVSAIGLMSSSLTTMQVPVTSIAAGTMVLVALGSNLCGGGSITPVFNASALAANGGGSTGASVICHVGTPYDGTGAAFLSANSPGGPSQFVVQQTSSVAITTSNNSNWAEVMVPIIPPSVQPTTIIGWNAPSASTLGHGIIALILVLLGVVFFGLLALIFDYKGDFTITLMLIGATAGLTLATLPSNGTNTLAVPFGSIVLGGFLLVVWLWKGATGGSEP
jgi:hypothetical protein